MEFIARIMPDRHLRFGQRDRAHFERYMAEHPGMLLKISPVLPESEKQRRFFEGAIVPLVAHYQDGMDHRDGEDLRRVREWLKEEFNGEFVTVAGKAHRVAKSTKGRDALQPFLERVVAWLIENYQPPHEALDPESFKRWQAEVFPSGGPDDYIDYLCGLNLLK